MAQTKEIIFLDPNNRRLDSLYELIRDARKNWRLTLSDDVNKAYELLMKSKYDLLVSDVIMTSGRYNEEKTNHGHRTGLVFWNDIRTNPELNSNKDIKILAYTIKMVGLVERDYIKAGADSVLYRPSQVEPLIVSIDKLIR